MTTADGMSSGHARRGRPAWLRRVLGVGAALAACAVVLGLGLGRPGAAPGAGATAAFATPEVPGRTFVGGTARLVGRGFPRHSFRFSWRVQQADATFAVQGLDGLSFSGATTTKRSLVTLTPDEPSSGQLATLVGSELATALGGEPAVTVQLVKQTLKLRTSAKRAARRLTGRFAYDVSVDGGPAKRLTLVLTGNGNPRRVLVLDDRADEPGSGPQVSAALAAAGHFPIDGGFFGTWDPAVTPLEEIEAVVLLQGHTSDDVMQDVADLQLADWIKFGGGIVRTEKSAYEAWVQPALRIDVLLPVQSPLRDYGNGATWTVERAQRRNPLARRMPRRFDVPAAGWSGVTALSGATVVYRSSEGVPMLTSTQVELGRVVHVNNDLTRSLDGGPIHPSVLRALVNAAEYVAP